MLDGFIWDGDGFEGNIEMNEKKAREILKTGQWDSQGVGLCGEIAAKHYLLALDKAKGLEEFIEYFLGQERMTFMECPQAEDLWIRAKEVLTKYRSEK